MEGTKKGGLHIRERAPLLRAELDRTEHFNRKIHWNDWFTRSFIFQLDTSLQQCSLQGITKRSIMQELTMNAENPYDPETARKARKRWQKTVWKRLKPDYTPALLSHLRNRLDRWNVPAFPGQRMERAYLVFQNLKHLVPPRVLAAILRTYLNGWVTAKRMQKRPSDPSNRCCFGCACPDSIEHYANCSVISEFARTKLRIRREDSIPDRMANFLILNHASPSRNQDAIVKQALRTAVIYRAHNHWRHHSTANAQTMRQSLPQHLKELIRGHPRAINFVENIWRN